MTTRVIALGRVAFGLRWGATLGALVIMAGVVLKDWLMIRGITDRLSAGHVSPDYIRAAAGYLCMLVGLLIVGRCAAGRAVALCMVLLALGAGPALADDVIQVTPPRQICATVSKVTLDGNPSWDRVTRAWTASLVVEITPPTLPPVEGVAVEPMPPLSRRASITITRAEIKAAAGKSVLTEVELEQAVRTNIASKILTLLAAIGG